MHRRGRRCNHGKTVKRWVRCDHRHSGRHGTRQAVAHFMSITLFLAGQAFELDAIEAFIAACDALHLKISDPAARFVAVRRYSITSSARASSDCGTDRPSAFAVLRLITSSYFVGACTGRSLAFSPLRMRST